jgi:hypothetical protein
MANPRSIVLGAALVAAVALACSERSHPAGPALLADDAASSGTQATAYSGSATVLRATVLGISTTLGDAGSLPSSGGAQEASPLLSVSEPGLLSAEVVHATTVGEGNSSHSEAALANVSLTVAGNSISADFLEARATATCTGSGASASGSSDIATLVINGQTIPVSGAPNQTVDLPLNSGEVIINEQNSNGTGDITVNALHVIVNGVADVIVSQAHADITCQPVAPNPPPPAGCPGSDFITGGGWITGTPSGARGNFAVAGGTKPGWGHLTYIDHGDGPRVKGTGVTKYVIVDATTRHIEGTAEINGQSGYTYSVDVSDNGEPGRGDGFTLLLSNGYRASSTHLDGGNIQLHTPCQ